MAGSDHYPSNAGRAEVKGSYGFSCRPADVVKTDSIRVVVEKLWGRDISGRGSERPVVKVGEVM